MRIKNHTDLPKEIMTALTKWCVLECQRIKFEQSTPLKGRFKPHQMSGTTIYYNYSKIFHSDHAGTGKGRGVLWIGVPRNGGLYTVRHLYHVVLHLGASLGSLRVGPPLPNGDLALYRQAIGHKFLAEGETLLAEWGRLVNPEYMFSSHIRRIKKAQSGVKRWTRKTKLAETKLHQWEARLRRAEKALAQARAGGYNS